jgi:hypothetical protein
MLGRLVRLDLRLLRERKIQYELQVIDTFFNALQCFIFRSIWAMATAGPPASAGADSNAELRDLPDGNSW